MSIYIKVEKDGQVSETTISQESIDTFKSQGVDLIEDTKQYLLKLTDRKIRNMLGNLSATPTFIVQDNK